MLPIMLIAMPAGAIADMYDRRIVALVALYIALSGATALAVLTWLGLVTPNLLLGLCFAVGELWRKLGDDGGVKAAYRGGCRACQNLLERAIRHEHGYQGRPASSAG